MYIAVAVVAETEVSLSSAPPPIAPHESVYPSNFPSVVLYLKSPATAVPGLCPVVPEGTFILEVPVAIISRQVTIPTAILPVLFALTGLAITVVPIPTLGPKLRPSEPEKMVLIPALLFIVSTLISAAFRVHSPPIFYYL